MTEFIGGALAMLDGSYWLPLLINAVLKGSLILVLAVLIRRLLKDSSASIRHAVGASALIALLALPLMWTLLPAWHVPFISSPPTFFTALSEPAPEPASASGTSESTPSQQASLPERPALKAGLAQPADETDSAAGKVAVPPAGSLADQTLPGSLPLPAPHPAVAQAHSAEEAPTDSEPAVRSKPPESVWHASATWLQGRWPVVLVGLWMAGALLLLARLLYAMLGVWWLISRARPCLDASWQRTAEQARRRAGVPRRVRLVFSDHLEVALSLGLWKPVIMLPSEARRWSPSRLESILLHEMAHVRRWDNIFNVLAQVVTAFYWFHPLVWWLQSRLTVDREQACDDAVLAAGTRAPEYAQHLLQVARAVLPTRRRLLRTVEVSQSSALKDRLEAILETGRNRTVLGGLGGAVILLALMLAAPLAVLRPWAQQGISLSRSHTQPVAKRAPQEPVQGTPQWKPSENEPGFEDGSSAAQRSWKARSRLASSSAPAAFAPLAGDTRRSEQGPDIVSVDQRLIASAGTFGEADASGRLPDIPDRTGLPLADASRLTFTSIAFPGGGGGDSPVDPVGEDPGSRTEDPESPQDPADPDGQDPGDAPDPQEPGPPDPQPEDPEDPESPDDPSEGEEGEVGMDTVTPDGVEGPFGQALDVNDEGTAVGIGTNEQGEFRPFIWDERSGLRLLDTLGGFGGNQLLYGINRWGTSAARAVAVNDRDQVIGISADVQGRVRSFFWSESTGMLDMGDLGGGETQVQALNEQGQAVGFSLTSEGRRRAFLWTVEDGIADLGGDPALSSEAHDINDLGQVVGEIGFRAFLWEEGAGIFRLASEEIVGSGEAINSSGAVVGWAIFQRGSPRRAFLWTHQEGMESLGTLGEEFDSSRAVAVNEEGAVLGSSSTPPNPLLGTQTQRAFVWTREAGMTDIDAYGGGGEHVPELALNNDRRVASRLPANPFSGSIQSYLWTPRQGTMYLSGQEEQEFHISSPTALNDSGEVAGTALVADDDPVFGNIFHPVIWRPRRLSDSESDSADPLADLREALGGLDENPGSNVRDTLNARLSAAARKLSAGQLRQAQIDLFRLAVLAENAVRNQHLSPAQGRRLMETAVSLMDALSR
ncbi:MAG TPA: M56 family metallopeptidase [Acidobacteriota bacterium]|nr:M56 family metallopeptidase [Acidobacteriota bacterium]